MVWLAILGILYYIFLPFKVAFFFLLSILSPVLHLGHYVFSVLVVPLRFLGNFEVETSFIEVVSYY